MTEVIMKKRAGRPGEIGLFTENEIAAEDFATIPVNQEVLVNARMPRNLRQHRLAWALASKVAESCDYLQDKHDGMDLLKIKARHVRYIKEPSGNVQIIPRSIAFASLSQSAFNRVFNRMVWIVCSEIIPGLKESDLRREIERMVK